MQRQNRGGEHKNPGTEERNAGEVHTRSRGNRARDTLREQHGAKHPGDPQDARVREPNGFAFRQENAFRRSGGSDSGSTKKPYSVLASARPAENQKGSRGSTLPNRPHNAGPTTKPSPNAAPIMPKLPARFSIGVTIRTRE